MFRKIYKQANDDIKPSEDMINRVILNAHKGAEKRQSPLPYRRYAKYAVSAAAAVVVVSAAVISMPYWQKTRDDGATVQNRGTEKQSGGTEIAGIDEGIDADENTIGSNADTASEKSQSMPVWGIILLVVVAAIAVAGTVLFIRKKKKQK